MIKAENISKSFGSLQVLKNISLEIQQGEFVSIVGQSGAGKTTLLQILGTLDKPDTGSVNINGSSVFDLNEKELSSFRNLHIGFVFQFHQLLPEFTALENVMIPALIAKKPKVEAQTKALELLEFLGMSERATHKPNELSGGERQRIAVARALVNHPDVLLADEPSGSLDSKNKAELNKLLLKLKSELNQTLVVVTHDSEMASISDRILKMQDGIIVS
ncbi:MAG: ABC transporter ATP-binding protein [Paludibacteraceae bacterium]|nr:ABC transporter ATP-binding protein [Paludibacteraceae bacterium]MBO7636311.1 ABC transporter ATP-binding protein [Paludibacteraceae bacterium]MBR5971197.1 ABC transporter ATP-binding protein [Paludibacteraceae bacterium]